MSLQQVFKGLYPLDRRRIDHTQLSVTVLSPREETLMPPEDYCPRFQTLLDVFTKRAAIKCPLFSKESPSLLVLIKILVLTTFQGTTLLKCRL